MLSCGMHLLSLLQGRVKQAVSTARPKIGSHSHMQQGMFELQAKRTAEGSDHTHGQGTALFSAATQIGEVNSEASL